MSEKEELLYLRGSYVVLFSTVQLLLDAVCALPPQDKIRDSFINSIDSITADLDEGPIKLKGVEETKAALLKRLRKD